MVTASSSNRPTNLPDMPESTLQQLLDLAAKFFKKDVSTLSGPGDIFESLGIDSVAALDLMTEVEDQFDIEIPDYELRDVKTFEQLASLVERRR